VNASEPALGAVELKVGEPGPLAAALAGEHARILLEVAFGADTAAVQPPGGLRLGVPNRALGGSPPTEVWLSGRPVERGRRGEIAWAGNGEALFGCVTRGLEQGTAAATRAAFAELLALADEQGCPHLVRVWNFLPGINDEERGVERYRLFNIGRAAAFDERYGESEAERRFSASSAVGAPGTRLVTCFAAAASAGLHLGNPRQVHAYRYPADYGPRAPSFSRATLAPAALGGALFLSGTASVAGHETRHAGSLEGQLDETLLNIEALLGAGAAGGPLPGLRDFDLVRIYLRSAAAVGCVRARLRERLGERVPLVFVEADICRSELLLEIEGVALG
jgi:chorismate lyase/3-hydroxybenzoate synthase